MEASPARPQNMIDTTDALEAVSACQSMKNFLFTLILIGLVLCQVIFWMNHFGLINEKVYSGESEPQVNACGAQMMSAPVFLAVTTDTAPQAEPAVTEPEDVKSIEQTIGEIVEFSNQENPEASGEGEMDTLPVEVTDPMVEPTDNAQPASEQAAEKPDFPQVALSLFRISAPFAAGLVAVCNFIIIVSVILYCLSLLMCLKISLAGRLGGINHITRAFFISLFLLVIITPWQVVLPKVLIGTTWLPGELLCGGWDKADGSIFWKVMFYLRFCGLPFVAVWFLLWTQIRSGKWTRATLRRLGVLR